jgi:quercetin dioxygenase-like cupin family protein
MHAWKHLVVAVASAALAAAVALAPLPSRAEEGQAKAGHAHEIVPADQMKWGQPPPSLPKGAQIAVIQGDPSVAGKLVTIRLKMPKGYAIPPHFHPTDEAVTVLSGAFLMGMGDRVDRGSATTLKPGGWAVMPANEHHYAVATEPTVVQVHMMGPFAITYVNPSDDPQKHASR